MLSISVFQTTPFFHIFSLPAVMHFDIQRLPKAQPKCVCGGGITAKEIEQ